MIPLLPTQSIYIQTICLRELLSEFNFLGDIWIGQFLDSMYPSFMFSNLELKSIRVKYFSLFTITCSMSLILYCSTPLSMLCMISGTIGPLHTWKYCNWFRMEFLICHTLLMLFLIYPVLLKYNAACELLHFEIQNIAQ